MINLLKYFKPDPPTDNEFKFWDRYLEFILQKDEPLSDDTVSRWHEEFVNSNLLEDNETKPND